MIRWFLKYIRQIKIALISQFLALFYGWVFLVGGEIMRCLAFFPEKNSKPFIQRSCRRVIKHTKDFIFLLKKPKK